MENDIKMFLMIFDTDVESASVDFHMKFTKVKSGFDL